MATSSTTTAAGTTITAKSTAASTAALQVAGPSTKEPIVEQLGQDTPSVIQGAHSEQRYGSQPYFSGQQYTTTAAQPYTAVPQPYNAAAQPYSAAAQPYIAPYNNMPATITRPGQSKDGQKALTVSVSTDSKKRKSESQDDAPQGPRKAKRNFRGDKNKGNKQ